MTKKIIFKATHLGAALAAAMMVSGWIPFTAPVTIHSTPEGAPVYRVGRDEPVGKTPFKTFIFLRDKEFELRLDQFRPQPVKIDFNSPATVHYTLRREPILVYTQPTAGLYRADAQTRVGETPIKVGVSSGKRTYVLKKKGYYDQRIELGPQTENPKIVALKRRPMLTLRTAQKQVKIYENGQFLAMAPHTEEIVKPRTFELRKEGYYTKTLTLTAAQIEELNHQLNVELKPLPTIEIQAVPATAQIFMAGRAKPIGQGSLKVKIAKKTEFTVKAERYYPESFRVEAKPQKATVNLEPMPYVTIQSAPSGAVVTLNGKRIGTTPIEQLIEEPVSITLRKEGYLPQTTTLDGRNPTPTITLEAKPIPKPIPPQPQPDPEPKPEIEPQQSESADQPDPAIQSAPAEPAVAEVIEEPLPDTSRPSALIGGITIAVVLLAGIIIGFTRNRK